MIENERHRLIVTLLCILGESTENHDSCASLWQWVKHEFMKVPPLCESLRKELNALSMSRLKPGPKEKSN